MNRVWFYDLSAGPESWGGNFDITNAGPRRRRVADYRIPVSWEYGSYRPRVGAARRPRQGDPLRRDSTCCSRASPLYPPYFTADQLPDATSTSTSTRSRAGRASTRRASSSSATCSSTRSASCRPASRSATTTRTCRSRRLLKRCFDGEFPSTGGGAVLVLPDFQHYPPDANLVPVAAFNHDRFLDRDADYEARVDQLLVLARRERRRSATPTTTGWTARRAACSASCRPASWRPATGSRRR